MLGIEENKFDSTSLTRTEEMWKTKINVKDYSCSNEKYIIVEYN